MSEEPKSQGNEPTNETPQNVPASEKPLGTTEPIYEVREVESESDSHEEKSQPEQIEEPQKEVEEKINHEEYLLKQEVPLKYAILHLETNREKQLLFRELILFIPFLILLLFFSFYRRDTMEQHYAVHALARNLQYTETPPTLYHDGAERNTGPHYMKAFADVDSQSDFQNWFEGVVIPTFYDSENRHARMVKFGPADMQFTIGALRVRMLKVTNDSCAVNTEFFRENTTKVCYGEFSEFEQDKTPFEHPDINITYTDGCKYKGQWIAGWYGSYPCGGYIVDFPRNATFNESLTLARQLREINFIDPRTTRFIAVEFITYAPSLDAFFNGRMFYEVTAAGGWISTARFKGFQVFLSESYSTGYIALSFIFFAFILYYYFRFWIMWFRTARKTRKIFRFIFSPWNFLEFVNLHCFLVTFGFTFEWWNKSSDNAIQLSLPNGTDPYPEILNYITELYYFESYFTALCTVITFVKVLKYFSMNDRLGILTRTLEASAQNIFGVLIIFVLIVTAFAVCGVLLYGSGVSGFRNLSFSYSTLFLSLLGSFDYNELLSFNRRTTFLYFWSYNILALFVMLNFIVAIIGNGFSEEQSKIKTLPMKVHVRRVLQGAKRFDCMGALRSIWNRFILRTRRLRRDVIADYFAEFRRYQLEVIGLSETIVDRGDEDEPDFMISRQLFDEVIPLSEMEYISKEYIDNLFCEMVEDYELFHKDENEETEGKFNAACDRGMIEAFVDMFVNNQDDIFAAQAQLIKGEKADVAGVLGHKKLSKRLSSFRSTGSGSQRKSLSRRSSQSSLSGADDESVESTANLIEANEVVNKLLGDLPDDETGAKRRKVAEQLLGLSSSAEAKMKAVGVEQLDKRIEQLESTTNSAKLLLNLISHRLMLILQKK